MLWVAVLLILVKSDYPCSLQLPYWHQYRNIDCKRHLCVGFSLHFLSCLAGYQNSRIQCLIDLPEF